MFSSVLSLQDDSVSLIQKWLQLLRVPVTGTTIQNTVLNHPEYPSLLSMHDALRSWNVDSAAIRLPQESILQIPVPFIAHHLTGDGEGFVLVTDANEDTIRYIRRMKQFSAPLHEFIREWDGIALLAQQNDRSGEKDYAGNRRKEKFSDLRIAAFLFSLFAASVVAGYSFYHKTSTLLLTVGYVSLVILELAGLIISTLLLSYEINKVNPALQKICRAGSKTNCNAVLDSEKARIFGWLSWSEIGFAYFGSGFISLLMSALGVSLSFLFLPVFLTAFALPYILFSIYYQWRVVKQWCVLCLAVQVILLLEFITSLSTGLFFAGTSLPFSATAMASFIILGMTLLMGWFFLKPLLLKTEDEKRLRRELVRLKANPNVWEALLERQKGIISPPHDMGIILGNHSAANILIKVCNPYCNPCAKAHPEIERLLDEHDNLKVQILFTATNDETDAKALPVKHLLSIADEGDTSLTKRALNDWYLADEKNYRAFADKYPLTGELKLQAGKVEVMSSWCREVKIEFTPTIFINGRQLPEIYNIEDIKHLIR